MNKNIDFLTDKKLRKDLYKYIIFLLNIHVFVCVLRLKKQLHGSPYVQKPIACLLHISPSTSMGRNTGVTVTTPEGFMKMEIVRASDLDSYRINRWSKASGSQVLMFVNGSRWMDVFVLTNDGCWLLLAPVNLEAVVVVASVCRGIDSLRKIMW